jgi:hypothetical protein
LYLDSKTFSNLNIINKMPITHKKVNRTKKVVRKSIKMSGGRSRKVAGRSRKVAGRSRKVAGRSRKMSVGGGKSRAKPVRANNAKKGTGFRIGFGLGRSMKMVPGYTKFIDYQANYKAKKARRNEQVQKFKRGVLSEKSIKQSNNAIKKVGQLFKTRKFRKAVLKRAKYENRANKAGKFNKANQKVEKSLKSIRNEAAEAAANRQRIREELSAANARLAAGMASKYRVVAFHR